MTSCSHWPALCSLSQQKFPKAGYASHLAVLLRFSQPPLFLCRTLLLALFFSPFILTP